MPFSSLPTRRESGEVVIILWFVFTVVGLISVVAGPIINLFR